MYGFVNEKGDMIPFEYEIDANDPFPGFMESLGYVRGLLAAIKAGV